MDQEKNALTVVVGDITCLPVEAIVNTANASLMGGGGVDGAIHRAGGGEILAACRMIRQTQYPDGLPTGEAVLTTAGRMPARFVIHTVGPIYRQDVDPAGHLAACYRNVLQVANKAQVKSIAFPSISTGVYGYPKDEAARIAVTTIATFLATQIGSVQQVVLVAFSQEDAAIIQQVIDSMT